MNILTYIEIRGGKIRPAGLEAVSAARKLADLTGGKLNAILVGSGIESLTDEIGTFGIDKVFIADNAELEGYSPEGYREAILTAAQKCEAKIVMISATAMGRDLAPTVAAKMDAALLPDCTKVDFKEGKVTVTRPVYAGRCMMTLNAISYPLAISVRPKAISIQERDKADFDKESLELDLSGKIKARLVETLVPEGAKLDVAEADVIVAGGRGMKEADNFKLIEELADTLGGAVGASRAVVDSEWRPHSEQVGQTGKVVSPTLYIAAGISGAIQHLAGMRTSKVIVAINKDPEAPIFKSADYGIIGDAMEVLPALKEAVKD